MFILPMLYNEIFCLSKRYQVKIKLFCNGILYEPREREIKNEFLTNVNLKKVRRKILPENGMPLRCDTVVAQK